MFPRRRRPRGRRSQPWMLVATTLAMFVALMVLVFQDRNEESSDPAPTPVATVLRYENTSSLQRAEVVNVIDGDTLDVRIDGEEQRLRYYGVDTPEKGNRCFDEARKRNKALAGDTILLLPDARDTDRYGRILRYVFTEDGLSIDESLVAEGYGQAWREDGAYRDEIVVLEEKAESQGVGCLWKEN
jgi:micrococcal nuclease